jgi:ABC-type uncharacterized transport system substrate-binding protein
MRRWDFPGSRRDEIVSACRRPAALAAKTATTIPVVLAVVADPLGSDEVIEMI